MELFTRLHSKYIDALMGESSDSLAAARQSINEEVNEFCQAMRQNLDKQYSVAFALKYFLAPTASASVRQATLALLEELRDDSEVFLYGDE